MSEEGRGRPTERDAFQIFHEMGHARSMMALKARLERLGYTASEAWLMRLARTNDWPAKIHHANRIQAHDIREGAHQLAYDDLNNLSETVLAMQNMSGFVNLAHAAIAKLMNGAGFKVKTVDDVCRLAEAAAKVAKASVECRTSLSMLAPMNARHIRELPPAGDALDGELLPPPPARSAAQAAPQLENAVVAFRRAREVKK